MRLHHLALRTRRRVGRLERDGRGRRHMVLFAVRGSWKRTTREHKKSRQEGRKEDTLLRSLKHPMPFL